MALAFLEARTILTIVTIMQVSDSLFRLDGKVALIAGAASGIGQAAARGLAGAGALAVCADVNAAGAEETAEDPRYAHLVGACRMGNDPGSSVVDRWGQSHDIANLFVMDGSVMPTQGSANPALTIMALASRLAQRLGRKHVSRERRVRRTAARTAA